MSKVPKMSKPTSSVVDVDALIQEGLKNPPPMVVTGEGRVTVGQEQRQGERRGRGAAPAKDKAEPKPSSRTAKPKGEPAPDPDAGMPWAGANERVIVYYQLRLPEPLALKLDWLVGLQKPGPDKKSRHVFGLEAFEREIERLVSESRKGEAEK